MDNDKEFDDDDTQKFSEQEGQLLYNRNIPMGVEQGGIPLSYLMRLNETATYLGVSRASLNTMMEDPLFPRMRVGPSGKQFRVPVGALRSYIDGKSSSWYLDK
ncbi:helix-turn-helix transcriptional regulator [Lacticaseibacillus brantae]|uniref:helix-turn-helix transcriptional regulator n=1 Tax=Lacticaseibacillus brantae TaxID=943673 RepID=UPI00070BD7CE|nr:DNA-binding protein [Lacticaseibacillus brantae]